MKSALQLDAAGVTDVGQKRDHNEDSLIVDTESRLFAIADGMGGHMSGEVASQATLEELLRRIKCHAESVCGVGRQEDYYNVVLNAVDACNELILEKNRNNGSGLGEGMGTTLVGGYFLKDKTQVVIFNVGDSRLYRFRAGVLKQLTRDHTMYQEWFDAGQQGVAPSRNILMNAIGLLEKIVPDITLESFEEGDLFLVCSDGLSNLVDAENLQQILTGNLNETPGTLCTELVSIANVRGGHDNISVIVIKVGDFSCAGTEYISEELDKTVQRKSV